MSPFLLSHSWVSNFLLANSWNLISFLESSCPSMNCGFLEDFLLLRFLGVGRSSVVCSSTSNSSESVNTSILRTNTIKLLGQIWSFFWISATIFLTLGEVMTASVTALDNFSKMRSDPSESLTKSPFQFPDINSSLKQTTSVICILI